ncbi:MAG: peptidase M28, partial [Eudoraea sp.]|nr:peptidase M28 [Eudoraea sp.]
TYTADAPEKVIPAPDLEVTLDTIIGDSRVLELCINPQRDVNRLDVFTDFKPFDQVAVNGISLSEKYISRRRGSKLITHYISDNDPTEIKMHFPKDSIFELTLYEASNDLLRNDLFSIPTRDASNIPMPFVLNDAILTISNWTFE